MEFAFYRMVFVEGLYWKRIHIALWKDRSNHRSESATILREIQELSTWFMLSDRLMLPPIFVVSMLVLVLLMFG